MRESHFTSRQNIFKMKYFKDNQIFEIYLNMKFSKIEYFQIIFNLKCDLLQHFGIHTPCGIHIQPVSFTNTQQTRRCVVIYYNFLVHFCFQIFW